VRIGRPDRKVALFEVHDGHPASRLQPGGELREIVQAIVDVVPGVDDEHEIDPLRRQLGRRRRQHGNEAERGSPSPLSFMYHGFGDVIAGRAPSLRLREVALK
jgi:hypothetical protein